MTVVTYKSTDASAPVLTGQVNSLVALLDACLVNGYTGKAAAGWTKPYTATNKAVFRMATSGNSGFYLDVDDNGPGAGAAKEARIKGYESMTAVATGTAPFPTVAQIAAGLFLRKSATADATARPWFLIADNSCFYLFVDTGDYTGPNYAMGVMFGDIFSYKSTDAYKCAIIARNLENNATNSYENLSSLITAANGPLTAQQGGHYIARSWTAVGASIQFAKHSSALVGINSSVQVPPGGAIALVAYPNGPDGALELAPIWCGHDGSVRGYLKGLWSPLHAQPLGHGDTFSGTGNMAGKTFLALNVKSTAGSFQNGQFVIETSDTWA